MVERFNGRVGQEVLTITVGGHRDLEHLLLGCNQAYNGRRPRVLHGRSPEDMVRLRLKATPDLANLQRQPPDPTIMPNGMRTIESAEDRSQPDPRGHRAISIPVTVNGHRIRPLLSTRRRVNGDVVSERSRARRGSAPPAC